MVVALPFIMAAAAVVGAAAAISNGQRQAEMFKYQADVAKNQAQAALQGAAYEAARQSEKAHRIGAQQETMFASSGMVGTEGSPLAIMADTAGSAELDRLGILHQGQLGYMRGYSSATGFDASAGAAESSGYMKAGTSLLSGASELVKANPNGWFSSSSGSTTQTNNATFDSSTSGGFTQNSGGIDAQ